MIEIRTDRSCAKLFTLGSENLFKQVDSTRKDINFNDRNFILLQYADEMVVTRRNYNR